MGIISINHGGETKLIWGTKLFQIRVRWPWGHSVSLRGKILFPNYDLVENFVTCHIGGTYGRKSTVSSLVARYLTSLISNFFTWPLSLNAAIFVMVRWDPDAPEETGALSDDQSTASSADDAGFAYGEDLPRGGDSRHGVDAPGREEQVLRPLGLLRDERISFIDLVESVIMSESPHFNPTPTKTSDVFRVISLEIIFQICVFFS